MPWFGKRHKQAKNFTPFRLKRKLNRRTVALRVFVGFLLAGGLVYYFLTATQAEAAWRDSSWLYRKKITIDRTKVPNTDQTNFPVLINTRDFDLKANAQSSGNDIMFTSSDGTTKLDHEIEKWDKTTGDLVAWVRVPTLATATDTVLYIYYGNTAAADQSNRTGVWDSNYKAVWHMKETSSSRTDATSNANTLSDTGGVTGSVEKIGNSSTYVSASGQRLSIAHASQTGLGITGNITLETWVNLGSTGINANTQALISKDGTAGNNGYLLRYNLNGKFNFILSNDGTASTSNNGATTAAANTWYHVVGVYNGTDMRIYVNGVLDNTATTYSSGIFATTNAVILGARATSSSPLDGSLDEGRVSSTARSADWIATEYNNQSSPSTFYTMGAKEQSPIVMFWRFDEGFGTSAKDSTGNGINGTITNATFTAEDLCIVGKCLRFNGSNARVVGTYDDKLDVSTNPFSADLWFKHPTGTSGTQILLSRYSAAGYKIYMNSSGFVCFGIDDDSTWGPDDSACSTTSYADSAWHQVKVVKTSTPSIVLYIDGKLITTTTGLTATGTLSGSSPTVNVGIDSDGTSNPWNGFIDEVKIYNGARTASQILADLNARGSVNGASTRVSALGSDLSNGLVGYWALNETSGNAADSSGNGTTLTNTNTATYGVGMFNNSGIFTRASSQYELAADNAALSITGNLTISAWILPSTVSAGTYNIAGKWDGANESYRLMQNGDELRLELDSAGNYVETTVTNLTASNWYHVVGTYDPVTRIAKIYVNGVAQTTSTTGTIPSSIGDDAGRFHIAAEDSTTTAANFFDGRIDDVRVYNRTLSAAEVVSLYDWAPAPVMQLKFDENSGTTANDSSGNSFSGTLTNSPTWVRGKYGGAIKFDGNDDAVATTYSLDNISPWSIGFWVNPLSLSTDDTFFSSFNTDFAIYYNSSNQITVCNDGVCADEATSIANPLTLNTWNYVEVTYTGTPSSANQMLIYVNGKNVTSDGQVLEAAQSGNLSVGAFDGTPAYLQAVDGSMDNIVVYNYPRSAKQVTSDLNAGHPPVGSPVSSPIGYWKLDEGNTTTAHNSGSGTSIDGTLTSMASPATSTSGWTNSGKLNKAINFDGTNDYVSIGNQTSMKFTGPITLSAWVKLTANSTLYGVISKEGSSGQFSYELVTTSSGKVSFDVSGTGSAKIAVTGNTTLSTGTWYHIAGVYIPSTSLTVYINGVQDGQNTTSVPASIFDGTGSAQIGAFNTSGFFNGTIDDVKAYGYALTTSDLYQDYNQSKTQVFGGSSTESNGTTSSFSQDREYCVPGDTSSCSAPIHEYKFDENTGSTAADTGNGGYSGTLTNSPPWVRGKFGGGLKFNGTSQRVVVNPSALTFAAGTLSAWVYPTAASPSLIETVVMGNREANRIYLQRNITNGNLAFRLGSGATTDTGTNIPTNTWSYIGLTWGGGTYITYLNGRQITTGAYAGLSGGDGYSVIGSYDDLTGGPDNYFTGIIDMVRMYTYVRTPAQMAWEYSKNNPNILWYKFDECSGTTANDASGSGNNGTITIGATSTYTSAGTCSSGTSTESWNAGTTGKFGSALAFDGTDDYVDAGDLPSTEGASQLSWEAWVKPTTLAANKVIVAKGNGLAATQASWGLSTLSTSPSGLRASISTNSTDTNTFASVSNALTDGTWTHIVAVFDGTASGNSNRLKVYLNGFLTSPTYTGTIPASTVATTSNVRVGSASDAAGYFNGQIDSLKIYSYALTAAQVKMSYNEGSALRFGP